jgi:uncharacterized membrane protein
MTIDAFLVTVLLSLVIPVLVSALTKAAAPDWVKDVANLILTGVAALITTATQVDGTAVISWVTFREWALALAISIAMYVKVWKAVGLNDRMLPNIGLGKAA